MNDTKQQLEELINSGKIYLIKNNKEGCFQLAYKEGEEADVWNDSVWELDLEILN